MKTSTKHKAEGAALAAGGLGIAFGAPAVSRVERKLGSIKAGKIERKIADVKASIPKKPDPALRRSGDRTLGETPGKKADRKYKTKAAHGQLHELNRQRNAALKPRVYQNQTKVWGTGLAVGLPTSYVGSRRMVEKKATDSDVNGAFLGGTAGFGAYQGGSLALKPLDRRAEKKIKADPKLAAKQRDYQRSSRPNNATAGDPRWRPYFRNYPKDLPGGKLKRALAVTHTGHSGTALTVAATAGGAAGGVKLMRDHEKKKLHKSANMSAFGVEH